MKQYIPRPTKSLIIIILLTFLFMGLSINLWITKYFSTSFKAVSSKDLTYQVFYTSNISQKFTEQYSVKQLVKAGKSKVKIIIPTDKITKFRLDFGNNPEKLFISNLKLNGNGRIRFDNFNKFNFHNINNKEFSPNQLWIKTAHHDPYIIYNDNLNLKAKMIIDWHIFIILTTFYFFVSWKLVKYLAKFKIEKNCSRIDIVFLTFFFALMFIPMSYISDAEKSEQENRMLAAKPSLKDVYGKEYSYSARFEKWFNDRFFGRDMLVYINSYIQNKLTKRGNERVLIGKNDWLFYKGDNSLRNFQNLDLFSEKELQKIAKYLSDINKWAKSHGKDFYYMICPDKNKIYSEYMLYVSRIYPNEKSRTNQLINYLNKNTDVKVVYPYKILLNSKDEGLLYWKNDTHWNELGAYIGYVELMSEIIKDHNLSIVKYNEFKETKRLRGDLTNMMIGLKDDNTSYKEPIITNNSKCNKNTNQKEDTICTNKKINKNMLIFRDSFAVNLSPYLNNTFGNVTYLWRYNITKEDLNKLKDNDIIILEQVERYIYQLVNIKFPEV